MRSPGWGFRLAAATCGQDCHTSERAARGPGDARVQSAGARCTPRDRRLRPMSNVDGIGPEAEGCIALKQCEL